MFLDTSGLFSLCDVQGSHHNDAVALFHRDESRLTTSYVLVELVALMLARGASQEVTLQFVLGIQEDRGIEIVWVTQDMHRAGMDFLLHRLDKNYTLCDAVSFLLMREREISDALTTDHHFEQEGLVRLLKQKSSKAST